jgi:hypothetical protein
LIGWLVGWLVGWLCGISSVARIVLDKFEVEALSVCFVDSQQRYCRNNDLFVLFRLLCVVCCGTRLLGSFDDGAMVSIFRPPPMQEWTACINSSILTLHMNVRRADML